MVVVVLDKTSTKGTFFLADRFDVINFIMLSKKISRHIIAKKDTIPVC